VCSWSFVKGAFGDFGGDGASTDVDLDGGAGLGVGRVDEGEADIFLEGG
jgi:hypothetical protein